jgi:small subunit ribosomal protein S9
MSAKQYTEGVGRRKTATARVRLSPTKTEKIVINDRPFEEYFKGAAQRKVIRTVLEVSVHVYGGGLSSQADAIKLGIARALVKEKADRRTTLKRAGFLKRDPRAVERKKFGLRKARRAPQWSKR